MSLLLYLALFAADGGSALVTLCVDAADDADDDDDDEGFLPSVDLCLTFDADICPCHILAPLERRTPFEEEFGAVVDDVDVTKFDLAS